ncbi:MAG: 50S ribosomal protein L23 [Dehalococcoidia bacterium]|nr:50S ribosomal protein L23 [Dehalococcoidia bacterium]
MHLYEVLRRPLVTEKNTILQELGKYVFEVHKNANKPMVKQAVQLAFKVKVEKVNIINVHGEKKRFGAKMITTPSWKKAVVTLKKGDKIQIFEGI